MDTKSLINYLTAFAVVSIIMATMYVVTQQTYRTGANDPQIQIAHDVKEGLEQGKSIDHLLPPDSNNLEKSLQVFVTFFDGAGNAVRSNAYLNNKMPRLPNGVYDFAKKNGEDWVTWQPEPGVRMATVILSVNHPLIKFIAIGRSLKEVEERESNLSSTVLVAWVICMLTILVNAAINFFTEKRKQTS